MQIESVPILNSGPFLGEAGIEQEIIDQAIDFLIKSLSQSYFNLLQHIFKDIRNDTYRPLQKIKITSLQGGMLGGELNIPEYLIKAMKNQGNEEIESLNKRYFAQFCYEVENLDQAIPIDHLLILLSQKITNLGFPSKYITVRFEKGCFSSQVQWWHRDTNEMSTKPVYGISTSYSTLSHWNTRILDEERTKDIFGKFSEIPPGLLKDSELIERVESLSTNAQLGYLYNVTDILHRAPRTTDLSPDLIDVNDYRLFIRFSNV